MVRWKTGREDGRDSIASNRWATSWRKESGKDHYVHHHGFCMRVGMILTCGRVCLARETPSIIDAREQPRSS